MVAAGIPEQWYDRLNEIGPKASLIPFVDDEPPFHLQRSSSDGASTQALFEKPKSSRFGDTSQPQRLSQSLLSQLELSKNDPNTFRDIIDDLTVQNKNLKRQLKKYEKNHSIGREHNGLFEIRIHSLSQEKKLELEMILQNFTGSIYPSLEIPKPVSATKTRRSLHRVSGRKPKISASSPPSMPVLDSAYASTSATANTFPVASDLSTRPITESCRHPSAYNFALHGTLSSAQTHDDCMMLDKKKQEDIVQKLEQLFEDDSEVLEILEKEVKEHEDLRQRRSPDHLRYLRHLGVVSPVTERSPQPSHDWVYLNLLVNVAQLHTLNVTSEFIRQAIHDLSTKLVLSDDGRKVRWRGNAPEASTRNNSYKVAGVDYVVPLTGSAGFTSAKRSEMNGVGASLTSQTAAHRPSTTCHQDTASHASSARRKAAFSRLRYKPLFTHRKGQSGGSRQEKDGPSVDSDTASLAEEEASLASDTPQTKTNQRSGPIIFFDRDPFFLDLSANSPDYNQVEHSSHGELVSEPLGNPRTSAKTDTEQVERSTFAFLAASEGTRPQEASLDDNIQSPFLTIYDDNETFSPPNQEKARVEHIQLEASGIGGIQLDDNFAIDIEREESPLLESSTRNRSIPNRLMPTDHHPPMPDVHHRLVSTRITHLPPSPLPPPSYVYPAFSSSSSDSGSDDGLPNDTNSDLELRPLSLSPLMQMFLEGQEEASAPEDDDEDMEADDEDEDY
ncbi:MAG: hypothetical protein Q9209_002879 [Squamulea sp. 1 TL-2023]